MKVLILSFLRIGDAVMHQEIIDAIGLQYPGAETHMACFEEFSEVQSILGSVSKFYFLPRLKLLSAKNSEKVPWLFGLKCIQDFLLKINSENYDLVLNATHTQFSAQLMSEIVAKEKRGAEIGKDQRQNEDYKYFNEVFSERHDVVQTYIDALSKALKLPILPLNQVEKRAGNKIYFQIKTSDNKKNWDFESWKVVFAGLLVRGYQVIILASSKDVKDFQSEFSEFQGLQYNTARLSELRGVLLDARLLVSLDTSVIHLAVQSQTPILGLYLGGANPLKTPPRLQGAYLLSANVDCHPCFHSQPCSQQEHLCSIRLSPYDVLNVIYYLLENSRIINLKAKLWMVSNSALPREVKNVSGTRSSFETSLVEA